MSSAGYAQLLNAWAAAVVDDHIAVFASDEDSYEVIEEQLTADCLGTELAAVASGPITRCELPKLNGFDFVIEDALDGGATTSLRMGSHDKSLSSLVLTIKLDP